ncbi:unnamed protein product [Cyprideis torosa]|uniref:Uncharacterized protein n=1 Tax=Cyprideis torosa TaxID=163714 RepID=A0A7R8W800_9CRUS|nr:unnamed protein product [Cyprideis torosa]CAG0883247.1 unnamed protein product [Cyprideis torosa]
MAAFARGALIVVNGIIVVLAIVVLALGIWAVVDKSSLDTFIPGSRFAIGGWIFIIVGGVTLLISILGFCGALKRERWMLIIYSVILFLIFLILLIGGILVVVFRETLEKELEKGLTEQLQKYNPNMNDPVKQAFDSIQQSRTNCVATGGGGGGGSSTASFSIGCGEKVKEDIKNKAPIVGGVFIGIALLLGS